MEDLLNIHQRLALKMTLRSFEESLGYCLSWLTSWSVSTSNDPGRSLAEAERQRALQLIARAREEITSLTQHLGLARKYGNPCVTIQARMMIARANLWDSRGAKLARFGRPASELAEVLDPSIARLADFADELAALFAERDVGGTRQQDDVAGRL